MININNAEVKLFNEIDSTNSAALDHLNTIGGISDPIWFRAKAQTKGRGRNKNSWVSDEGNLFTTLLTPISWKLNIIPMLSCVIAASVHQSVSFFLDNQNPLKIKWPNDILINKKKVSGIIIETTSNNKKKIKNILENFNFEKFKKLTFENDLYSFFAVSHLISAGPLWILRKLHSVRLRACGPL